MGNIIDIPAILLPQKDVDINKWACVACDQFCAEPEYWENLKKHVGDAPGALNLIIPELYLNDNQQERVRLTNVYMKKYLDEGVFDTYNGMILVERDVGNNKKRIGLMLSVDLESYDYHRVFVPIRATEGTILSRLPARVEIRRNAPIELPHVMLLIDNKECNIIEEIYKNKENLDVLYDAELNMDGGHIKGYAVTNPKGIIEKLQALGDSQTQISKYGTDAKIVFAVGDGNHSMASAKALWDEVKVNLTEQQRERHPKRFMLVEVVNLYEDGMEFHPIHRWVQNADMQDFANGLQKALNNGGTKTSKISLITNQKTTAIDANGSSAIIISNIQSYIEDYIAKHNDVEVEYVHNQARLEEVVKKKGGIGIVMPCFVKEELFDYVVNVGNLPKKAFSVGEPEHKRYYLEAKSII